MTDDEFLRGHLRRMRLMAIAFLLTLPAAAAAAFHLPRVALVRPSPAAVTVVMLLVAGWFAFTANRHANQRLGTLREQFSGRRDPAGLFRGHLKLYLVVLLRLEIITACALVTAAVGAGPHAAPWFLVVAGVLMLLAWPTERKARLLLRRVDAE